MNSATENTSGDRILYVRIGAIPRTRILYLPPEQTLTEYLKHAEAHDGRLLFTGNQRALRNRNDIGSIIFYTPHSELKIVGDVADMGDGYNPKKWNPDSSYQAAFPWNRMPANQWIALDHVRRLDDFDPDGYVITAGKEKGKKLSEIASDFYNYTMTLVPADEWHAA